MCFRLEDPGVFIDVASDLVLRFLDTDQESVVTTTSSGSPQFTLRETCSEQCHPLSLLPLLNARMLRVPLYFKGPLDVYL